MSMCILCTKAFPSSAFVAPQRAPSCLVHPRHYRTPIGVSKRGRGVSIFSRSLTSIRSGNKDNDETVVEQHMTLDSGLYEAEMEVKKSRFIGYAQHVESWSQAQDVIASIRALHPKSRHACFGMLVTTNSVLQERCSDDGEPTGTAGVPILGAIRGEGLTDTLCVVVRYFGGIKLGAGGLIRAYGGAARLVLREAPTKIVIPKSTLQIKVSSANAGSIYHAVQQSGGTVNDELYDDSGDMTLSATCETQNVGKLKESIRDATRGSAEFLDDSE